MSEENVEIVRRLWGRLGNREFGGLDPSARRGGRALECARVPGYGPMSRARWGAPMGSRAMGGLQRVSTMR